MIATIMDVDQIPDEVLIAKGKYAVIRGRHRDLQSAIMQRTAEINVITGQMQRAARDNDNAAAYVASARVFVDQIEDLFKELDQLNDVLAELKPIAWPKGED